MVRNSPKIQFIDTTLREGFQSATQLFSSGVVPADYAKMATANLNTAYMEIYGPEFYYSTADYELLAETLRSQLQLYCGVVNKFEPAKKPHINNLHSPRLSLTVIDKSTATIEKLQHVLNYYPSATLRLGIECAGSTDTSVLFDFLQKLANTERVDNITLSDSNGTMTPESVRELILNFSEPIKSTLGFHLHNDRGLAAANALTAIEACTMLGQEKVSFDYTYGGLGERYGLLSLQEIAAFGQPIIQGDSGEKIKEMGHLFTDEALHFHSLPYMKEVVHVAASHFDTSGNLRPEYRTSAHKIDK